MLQRSYTTRVYVTSHVILWMNVAVNHNRFQIIYTFRLRDKCFMSSTLTLFDFGRGVSPFEKYAQT